MVQPLHRREMAQKAVLEKRIRICLSCWMLSISESCYRYQATLTDENRKNADCLIKLTYNQREWGCCLCFLQLRKVKGFRWNHKRIYRELKLNMRIKPKKRLILGKPEPFAVPETINDSWAKHFRHDQLSDGRRFRLPNLNGNFN